MVIWVFLKGEVSWQYGYEEGGELKEGEKVIRSRPFGKLGREGPGVLRRGRLKTCLKESRASVVR